MNRRLYRCPGSGAPPSAFPFKLIGRADCAVCGHALVRVNGSDGNLRVHRASMWELRDVRPILRQRLVEMGVLTS